MFGEVAAVPSGSAKGFFFFLPAGIPASRTKPAAWRKQTGTRLPFMVAPAPFFFLLRLRPVAVPYRSIVSCRYAGSDVHVCKINIQCALPNHILPVQYGSTSARFWCCALIWTGIKMKIWELATSLEEICNCIKEHLIHRRSHICKSGLRRVNITIYRSSFVPNCILPFCTHRKWRRLALAAAFLQIFCQESD